MTQSAAPADAFFTQVVGLDQVWALRDDDGFLAPANADGQRAMPFWSSRERAERVVNTVPAYQHFAVVGLALDEWTSRWLPGLEKDGLLVGLNWSGGTARGYDIEPSADSPETPARRRSA